uniref:BCL2 like 12 n=1 Tax=Lynx canadensis TaxID=61383 RepID=A0A667HUY8_LYNCA
GGGDTIKWKVQRSFAKCAHWASVYPIVKWKSLLPGKAVGTRRESITSPCPGDPSLALFTPGPATPDFYALVAQRLEQLVQEQLRSPPSPELQGPPPTEKEALLRKLVALLEEEADVINQKLASDPALRGKLARLSSGSFARLVELFSCRESSPLPGRARPSLPCPGPPPPSPEPLARLALAMELSRRVAGLGGTLAGLSVEHVHSFAPWIQAHGGWEGILAISPVDLNLPLD